MKMLMKKSFLFVIIALILLASAGCDSSSANEEDNGSTSEKTTQNTLNGTGDDIDVISNAKVQINQLADEVLNQYESFSEFIHEENGVWLVVITDRIIQDFEYIKIGHAFIENNTVFFVDCVEYSADELIPEEPFKIKTFTSYGTMPHYGVSFIDTDNVKKYFYISESGMDGSLSLVEFENDTSSTAMLSPAENSTSSPEPAAYQDIDGLGFGDLADMTFVFASGVGAWSTEVKIEPDGTFVGLFNDSNMGESGDDYPEGTVYYCSFSGKFSSLEKTGAYEYSMRCESLMQEGIPEDETISDGRRYVVSRPYGFDNADIFFLYLPGKSVDELPTEFSEWVCMPRAVDFKGVAVIDFWGLYNATGKQGFSW